MRILTTAVLIAALAGPALAQADPAWIRQREAALQAQRDAARDSRDFQREQEARRQRAATDATVRALKQDDLAGGPGALPRNAPSTIIPMEPPPRPAPRPALSADQNRMDALIAAALARSNARAAAVTADGNR